MTDTGATMVEIVVGVFRDVLKNPSITADDDFFAAGGDSLLALDAVQTIADAVGYDVEPMIIFMYPTPVSCGAALTGMARSG